MLSGDNQAVGLAQGQIFRGGVIDRDVILTQEELSGETLWEWQTEGKQFGAPSQASTGSCTSLGGMWTREAQVKVTWT